LRTAIVTSARSSNQSNANLASNISSLSASSVSPCEEIDDSRERRRCRMVPARSAVKWPTFSTCGDGVFLQWLCFPASFASLHSIYQPGRVCFFLSHLSLEELEKPLFRRLSPVGRPPHRQRRHPRRELLWHHLRGEEYLNVLSSRRQSSLYIRSKKHKLLTTSWSFVAPLIRSFKAL
jgi:hypothetical protein